MGLKKRIIDRAVPVIATPNGFVTSASASIQYLSNGWLIAAVRDGITTGNIIVLFSKDEGSSWNQLCYTASTNMGGWSIASYGTIVHLVIAQTSSSALRYFKFDATTVSNTQLPNEGSIDSGQNAMHSCFIGVNPDNGHMTAVWSCKNNSYNNGWGLRSAKSINGGNSWTMQNGSAGIDYIWYNSGAFDATNPFVVYNQSGYPVVFYNSPYLGTTPAVMHQYYDSSGGFWSGTSAAGIFYGAGYTQQFVVGTTLRYGQNKGRIWIAWVGLDDIDTGFLNARAAYSDNNGVSFVDQKLTTGNFTHMQNVSIASDLNGNTYVCYKNTSSGFIVYQKCSAGTTTFGSATTLLNFSSDKVSACNNFYNFYIPLAVSCSATEVKFVGKWFVMTELKDSPGKLLSAVPRQITKL